MLHPMTIPTFDELPERAQDLLNAMQGRDWMKRQDIAKAIGKSRLNEGDNATLEMLAAFGFIEAREVETNAPSGVRFEYRAKSDS